MSRITVSDIWAEDLFEWFDSNIVASGGDGVALIVCENYKEVATWFVDWWEKKHNRANRFPHPRDEDGNTVNYRNSNENYIFSDIEEGYFSRGDYVFIVVGDCRFGFDKTGRVIKAAKLN